MGVATATSAARAIAKDTGSIGIGKAAAASIKPAHQGKADGAAARTSPAAQRQTQRPPSHKSERQV